MTVQDEPFQFFTLWDSIESGLYMVIIGYYFLIFAYFLLMRFRTSKKLYWLFFSILFLFLAGGRAFLIAYYFYLPELEGTISDLEIASLLNVTFRVSTCFTWIATASTMGVLGILLFPPDMQEEKKVATEKTLADWFKNKNNIKILVRLLLICIPIIIGILALTLPDNIFLDPDVVNKYGLNIPLITIDIGTWSYPVGRFILTLVLLPLFVVIIPFIFLYLALKTFGVLRRSYALNALGFFLYYAGRIAQGLLDVVNAPHFRAIMPPLIILLALLIIVIANNYEQLR